MSKFIVIAIDGPAASGKSTAAKAIASKLGFLYIDSGAMYRSVTCLWLKQTKGKKSDSDAEILTQIIQNFSLEFCDKRVIVNEQDFTESIRSFEVGKYVSYIASFALVREALVEMQRTFASSSSVVMDGRDIGTVVFPGADVKIYLQASVQVRAERRYKEMLEQGKTVDFDALVQQIEDRDKLDSERAIAPLKPAPDAVHIISDNLTVDEIVSKIIGLVLKTKN